MSLLVPAPSPLRGALALRRRGAVLPRRRQGGAALGIVLGIAAGIAGCGGGQPSVALPRKDAVPAVPAASSGQPTTTQDQVVAAYTGYWQALGQALDARNAARAEAILAPYAAPSLIPSLVSGFQTDWARGEIQYGAPVPHILSVQVTGGQAYVHDCGDFSHAGVQLAATGQVIGSLGDPRVNMVSLLVLTGGRWLLTNQEPVAASCSP